VRKVLVVGLLLVVVISLVTLAGAKKFAATPASDYPGPLGSIPNGGVITDITWGKGRSVSIEMWRDEYYSYKVDYVEFGESQEGPEDVGLGMADQWAPI
jgi:hypothetical protein